MILQKAPALLPTGTARAALVPPAPAVLALCELVRSHELGAGGGFLAWQLGEMAAGLTAEEQQAFVLLAGRLLSAQDQGSTRLQVDCAQRALLAEVPDLVGSDSRIAPLILDGEWLYTQRSHACEIRVAAALADRLRRPGPFAATDVAHAVADVVKASTPAPSEQQAHAAARS